MPSLSPHATVIRALAEREAELLQHGRIPTTGHALIAILWEGKGVAARVLREVGLDGGHAEIVRQRVRQLPAGSRGKAFAGLGAAEASELGHDYIGTEHKLLAITRDESLDASVLDGHARQRVRERVLEIVKSYGNQAGEGTAGR
jgi:ATP-dependent Clp protease ATP-binding subunit ClpC